MKKLMVAAVAMVLGSSVFGALVDWNLTQGTDPLYAASSFVNNDNKGTPVTSGTLYLFYGSYAQSDLYDALKSGTSLSSLAGTYGVKASDGTTTFSADLGSNGKFADTTFMASVNEGSGGTFSQSFYEVVQVGDEYWFGQIKTDAWNSQTDGEHAPAWAASGRSNVDHRSLDSYATSAPQFGWYTAAVPEPTSGLLLLLGMAGLALRRRRA